MSRKEKKKYDDDDGQTIIDMNVDGMPGYMKPEHRRRRKDIQKLNISKKERRAIIWAGFLAVIPRVVITILCVTTAFLLVYFWLK